VCVMRVSFVRDGQRTAIELVRVIIDLRGVFSIWHQGLLSMKALHQSRMQDLDARIVGRSNLRSTGCRTMSFVCAVECRFAQHLLAGLALLSIPPLAEIMEGHDNEYQD
jgi:hypothetical protein